jgi:hypothetical protein
VIFRKGRRDKNFFIDDFIKKELLSHKSLSHLIT